MDGKDVEDWFANYLDAFAACAPGEREISSLLSFYGIPPLITSDSSAVASGTEGEVAEAVRQQIDQVRSAAHDRSEVVSSEGTILNATSALYRWTVSRQRQDGGEVGRVTFTELLTASAAGPRISAIAVHSA